MHVHFASPLGVVEYSHERIKKRMRMLWVDLWLWSNDNYVYCICAAKSWTGFISGVWWWGALICSPLIAYVRSVVFDLLCLGLGRSKETFRRTQIHPIWQPWLWRGGVWIYLFWQNGFFAMIPRMMTLVLSYIHVGFCPVICPQILRVWVKCTIFSSFYTAWLQ